MKPILPCEVATYTIDQGFFQNESLFAYSLRFLARPAHQLCNE
nr:MAG TPA: hypothetical protein [Caudoviricetes sp.]